MTSLVLPTNADIEAAARVLAPVAVRTRLVTSPALDALTGARVFLKPEVLQRTGSFKFRGAFNKLSSIPEASRKAGVVAFSSGNHAQGVAAAAQLLSMPAVIVMPSDAPVSKIERTKSYGAEVVPYDRDKEDRDAIARDLASKRGATVVPPYDDPWVIAGQGTVGREIAEDFAAFGLVPDLVSAPASGGGLMAGIALATKAKFPNAGLMTVEPYGFDDHARSFSAGERQPHRAVGRTICDALMASIPGEITFAVNEKNGVKGVTATDDEVAKAVAFAFRELKLVVEPGGAVALAALLAGHIDARGKTIAIVLSGGNVDADLYAKLIQ
ncbi:threonine dehydratase [Afipia massiliensis]|uniref:Threonine dehydratase n=1 Tax=Afipia massiliensis TaxID=211460 RepID=A0A840N6P8_9BRAD|nr:threonine/serine dehydratase [Afipia massiliensis]MBB5054257.1 threonine dehydratase [Afipia massiliensis]